MNRAYVSVCALALVFLAVPSVTADDKEKGLPSLDQATELQLTAESLNDMERVVELCEKALADGLNEENQKFTKQLVSSTLLELARRRAGGLAEGQREGRWKSLRDLAVKDLDKSLKYDDASAQAHMLRAKLLSLPEGDAKKALESASKAIDLLKDDKAEQSMAYLLRAQLRKDPELVLDDLDAAVKAHPENSLAWETRAMFFLSRNETDKAVSDFEKLVEHNPDNAQLRQTYAQILAGVKKYEEAVKQLDEVIKANPEGVPAYMLRARILMAQMNYEGAMKDLNKVVDLEPADLEALLMRADIYEEQEKYAEALADVDRVLQLRPKLPQAILMRAAILAAEKKYDLALADLGKLLSEDPKNTALRLQIARLYLAGGWPRKCVQMATEVAKQESDNWVALGTRGDAYLAIGKHAEAIADYEKAIELSPENSNILNNYAWVMATSPQTKVRNAKKAIEFGTRACEVTQFKQAHILSTLAAGYAESGDFDTAIKWSTKAVELGKGEVKEQLEKELESYKQKKPWREMQETDEKPNPPVLRADLDL